MTFADIARVEHYLRKSNANLRCALRQRLLEILRPEPPILTAMVHRARQALCTNVFAFAGIAVVRPQCWLRCRNVAAPRRCEVASKLVEQLTYKVSDVRVSIGKVARYHFDTNATIPAPPRHLLTTLCVGRSTVNARLATGC